MNSLLHLWPPRCCYSNLPFHVHQAWHLGGWASWSGEVNLLNQFGWKRTSLSSELQNKNWDKIRGKNHFSVVFDTTVILQSQNGIRPQLTAAAAHPRPEDWTQNIQNAVFYSKYFCIFSLLYLLSCWTIEDSFCRRLRPSQTRNIATPPTWRAKLSLQK